LALVSMWLLVRLPFEAVGRVDLDDSGVRVRRLSGLRKVDWADVWQFEVVTTLFGRYVSLTARGRPLRLPVPATSRLVPDRRFDRQVDEVRDWCAARATLGARPAAERWAPRWVYPVLVCLLVTAALVLDRPWGWLAGPEAADLPDPCVVPRDGADVLVVAAGAQARPWLDGPANVRACRWTMAYGRILVVQYTRYQRSGVHSATAVADAVSVWDWESARQTPVPDAPHVGDESELSYVWQQRSSKQPIGLLALARRANVIVSVYYGSELFLASRPELDLRSADLEQVKAMIRVLVGAVELR
jgi:hypothetical protein